MTNPNEKDINRQIEAAARLLSYADGIVIAAGAGMGVDSGLPDFRSKEGFWSAYPALGDRQLGFESIACPAAFKSSPQLAWGFYGHRLQLYREAIPHDGFYRLLEFAKTLSRGAGVYTSNVDGQFQKAGFHQGQVTECHGSIHYLQCINNCGQRVWSAESFKPIVDVQSCMLLSPLPVCPSCGCVARPNIKLFNDWNFLSEKYEVSGERLRDWIDSLESPVVIEIGAGVVIPAVRNLRASRRMPIIRINPEHSTAPYPGDIGIVLGAKEAILRIADRLNGG